MWIYICMEDFNSLGRRILKLVVLISLRFSDEEDIISFCLFTSIIWSYRITFVTFKSKK